MERESDISMRQRPDLTARAAAGLAARREREAAALRANLRRRKDQARARDDGASLPDSAPASGQSEVPR